MLTFAILPGNAKSLPEAAANLAAKFTAQDWQELDERIQVRIRRECSALVKAALSRTRYEERLANLLWDECLQLVDERLPKETCAQMYVNESRDPQTQHKDLQKAYDEMQQTLLGSKSGGEGVFFVGLPMVQTNCSFESLLHEVLTEQTWQKFQSDEDIHLTGVQAFELNGTLLPNSGLFDNNLLEKGKNLFARIDFNFHPALNLFESSSVNREKSFAEL